MYRLEKTKINQKTPRKAKKLETQKAAKNSNKPRLSGSFAAKMADVKNADVTSIDVKNADVKNADKEEASPAETKGYFSSLTRFESTHSSD